MKGILGILQIQSDIAGEGQPIQPGIIQLTVVYDRGPGFSGVNPTDQPLQFRHILGLPGAGQVQAIALRQESGYFNRQKRPPHPVNGAGVQNIDPVMLSHGGCSGMV